MISIAPIHQACIEYAMFHSKCMTQLMVYYLLHHLQIKLIFIFLLYLLFDLLKLIALFNHFSIRHYTCPIFNRAQAKDPSFTEKLNRVIPIVDQQICQNCNRIAFFWQIFSKINIHEGSVIVSVSRLGLDWIEFGQISLLEMISLYFYITEKCLCVFLKSFQVLLREVGIKGGYVNYFFFRINMIPIHGSKQRKGLAILFILIQTISWFWFFYGLKLFDYCLKGFFDSPLFSDQRSQANHPFLFIGDNKRHNSNPVSKRVDPLNFLGLLLLLDSFSRLHILLLVTQLKSDTIRRRNYRILVEIFKNCCYPHLKWGKA